MSDERFVSRENENKCWDIVDQRTGKVAGIALSKEYADAAAMYFNVDRAPLTDEEKEAMRTYREGERVTVAVKTDWKPGPNDFGYYPKDDSDVGSA